MINNSWKIVWKIVIYQCCLACQVLNVGKLGHNGLARFERKNVINFALLTAAVLLGESLKKPVRMRYTCNWIWDTLESGGYRDYLLNAAVEPLDVVVPVEEVPKLKVRCRLSLEPFAQVMLGHTRLRLKYSNRYCTIGDRRAFGLLWNNIFTIQTFKT